MAALTTVENKIPDVSNVVKKKRLDIESKHFTTADYNKFTSQTLDEKIKQKELFSKSDIADLVKKAGLDKKSSNISNKSRVKSSTR